ncbi:MAG: ATP-dependent DNA helicase [Acidobacteria bacterium]|nr:ATP-dependent DNA helicase [Acidobacteriota bacterium]
MAVRVDLVKRTVSISPAALLGGSFRRIGLDRAGGNERVFLGQAIHRRVLGDFAQTLPGYRSEERVVFSFPVDDFTVTFEGRLDGRFEDARSRVIVDEVKSLHFAEDLPKLAGSPRLSRYELQLRWYLYGIHVSEGRDVEGRLVFADIETGALRTQAVSFDPGAVLADLVQRVRAFLDVHFEYQALAEAKAAEADYLEFPFPAYRPGQREMSAAVSRAAEDGEHLLVEAPTGIGKTAAALLPLLQAALKQGKRLYILTAKTTQQENYRRALAALSSQAFRSLRLRAKQRMCANDVVLCHEDHCRFAKDYGGKMEASGLLDRLLLAKSYLDPTEIFEEARREEVCPFEVSLELAERVDVIIGDYNYVFDPIVSLSGARDPESLSDSFLLVDEAHNLVDRGRGYYSPELSEEGLAALDRELGISAARAVPDAAKALLRLRELVVTAASAALEPGESAGLVDLRPADLDDLRLDLESILIRHLADMRQGGDRVPDDPILELDFTFARFHDVLALAVPDGRCLDAFDVLATRTERGLRLAILCKDPSGLLGPILNAASATVAMSATLTPPEFYRDLLGLEVARTSLLRLPSPFPRENRRIVIAHEVDTTYSARAAGTPGMARLVADLANACPGNVLALFPSYRFLDDVRAQLPGFATRRVLRPTDRSSELERDSVLEALSDGGPPVLLLAVSGGAFAEGVDYAGEMLHAVVVVSPALPAVRFEQERMKEYFQDRFEKGFEYAYVIPGMTRVVQSAGRVIRSETDVGVIVLACKRFLKSPYRRYLPADWFDERPEELAERDIGSVSRAFFDRVARRELPVGPLVPLLPESRS